MLSICWKTPARAFFVTGRAGTGKATLLNYFRHTTRKKVVVLASTGVSALYVQRQTIHSSFRFKPDITPDKVKKSNSMMTVKMSIKSRIP